MPRAPVSVLAEASPGALPAATRNSRTRTSDRIERRSHALYRRLTKFAADTEKAAPIAPWYNAVARAGASGPTVGAVLRS